MIRKTIAVLFGGKSSEHEISKLSAYTIISNLCKIKYCILPIYITRKGEWKIYDGDIGNISRTEWEKYSTNAIISPDETHKGIIRIIGNKIKIIPIDMVIPVLHGKNGEDGTVQGLLELANVSYVGCGVLSSAIAMDKVYTKILVDNIRINQAKYKVIFSDKNVNFTDIEDKLGYPCFIKPANAGSSRGISKANNIDELKEAIKFAFKYDRKIIIEEAIVGREIECAILGNDEIITTNLGEILSNSEFYDFNSKYNDKNTKTKIANDISVEILNEIQEISKRVFRILNGKGLARIDFFIENGTNKIIFNEINTMPGFTDISMYPTLCKDKGFDLPKLLDKLIDLAINEFEQKNQILE